MTTPIPNIPQEQLDEEAARQRILCGSYRKAAVACCCSPTTAYERAKRWAGWRRIRKETTMKVFDSEAVYDNEIAPLLRQVVEICVAHNLPFVAAVCYSSDGKAEDGIGLVTSLVSEDIKDRFPERMRYAMAELVDPPSEAKRMVQNALRGKL